MSPWRSVSSLMMAGASPFLLARGLFWMLEHYSEPRAIRYSTLESDQKWVLQTTKFFGTLILNGCSTTQGPPLFFLIKYTFQCGLKLLVMNEFCFFGLILLYRLSIGNHLMWMMHSGLASKPCLGMVENNTSETCMLFPWEVIIQIYLMNFLFWCINCRHYDDVADSLQDFAYLCRVPKIIRRLAYHFIKPWVLRLGSLIFCCNDNALMPSFKCVYRVTSMVTLCGPLVVLSKYFPVHFTWNTHDIIHFL